MTSSGHMHAADSDNNYEFEDDQDDDDHDGDSMSGEYYESQVASSSVLDAGPTNPASMMPPLSALPHAMLTDNHLPVKMRATANASVPSPSMLEARIQRLETENLQLKYQVEDVGLKSLVLQSILDEIFQMLSGRNIASIRDDSAKTASAPSGGEDSKPEGANESKSGGLLVTEGFVEEAKRQILHNAAMKARSINPNVQFPLHMHSMLYQQSSYYGINGMSGMGGRGLNSMDFTFDDAPKMALALHSLDGMELSRLRDRGDGAVVVPQPTSFDLAASSVHQPCSSQLQRLNSFFDGTLGGTAPLPLTAFPSSFSPSDPLAMGSSLELLSTSADILTERDSMSSHDHSNFAAANASARSDTTFNSTKDSGNEDVPLAKKQRSTYDVTVKEESVAASATIDPDRRSEGVLKTEPMILSASQHANEPLRRQDAVVFDPVQVKVKQENTHPEPAELLRFDSNATNFSRLDSLDSALSTILRNI